MLEEALKLFDGTLLVISHDRYFISQVANTIAAFEDKTLVRYNGDYKFYMDSNARLAEKVCAGGGSSWGVQKGGVILKGGKAAWG